jgi:glycosyltransferase involved in cell wall biosynthesis
MSASAGRVLILVENLPVPFDRRVWQESLALTAHGYEVVVVCPRGKSGDSEPHDTVEGVEIYRYPLKQATGGPLGYAREYATAVWRSLRLSLRLGPFDVVHACNPPDLLFLVALPFKIRGARFVFDQHDLVPELYLSRFARGRDILYRVLVLLERMTYGLADVVIVTNESYRRIALQRGSKAPDRVFVVRSAPDLARLKPLASEPSLKNGKEHLLCYLGVMGPQDGVDYALRALAKLRDVERRSDWHAVFIGSGDAFEAMVALAGRLGLSELVTFTGRLADKELARYLSTADVCLAPDPLNPLNDVSTMNKILEYMAFGRPIVTFDLREARVSAGDAALYAPPNDESAFARLVVRLLDDPDERERRGKLGRERLEQSLSWEHSRRALLSSYAVALSS